MYLIKWKIEKDINMELKIKDDSIEIEHIEENKKMDEYRVLKSRIEYIYRDYLEQKDGLNIRRNKLKAHRDHSIKSVIGLSIIILVLFYVESEVPSSYLLCVILAMPTLCVLVAFAGSAILRVREYAVMTEKQKAITYFSDKEIITFNQEERFLNEMIEEYKTELNKDIKEDELTEDILFRLTKMTFPKQYYASAVKLEFKRSHIYMLMFVLVAISLILTLSIQS